VTNETGKHDPQFATLAVHAGAERDATGALAPALYLSTNYEHGPAGERRSDYLYIRIDSPTQPHAATAGTCPGDLRGRTGGIRLLVRGRCRGRLPAILARRQPRALP
jgi:hypothetical protein